MEKSALFGIALAAFGLFACDQAGKTTAPPASGNETGSARILLPAAPAQFLAKSAAGSEILFGLTVTGFHMDAIRKTWKLASGSDQTVTVDGIPSGVRFFEGVIMEVDGASGDTLVTHRGGDSANIVPGRVTDVRLYMGRERNGEVKICLEVEGWATNPGCIPAGPEYAGCWALSVSGTDTARPPIQARLRLVVDGSAVTAYLAWSQSEEDTATGTLENGLLYIGADGTQPFRIKGSVYGGILRSDLSSPRLAANGFVRGIRGDCRTVPVPEIRDFSGCWEAAVLDQAGDTLAAGALNIVQMESALKATQELDPGFAPSLTGYVREDGTGFLQKQDGNSWFKGTVDKQGGLRGSVNNYPDGISGELVGKRGVCPPLAD